MKRLFLSLIVFSIILFIFSLLVETDFTLYTGSAAIHMGIFSVALFFLWKKDVRTTLDSIGFPGDLKNNIVYPVMGLGAIFVALLILGIVATLLGFNDQQEVFDKVNELPLFILAFAVIAAPISEELFFRAFLVPRLGALISSLIFGAVHFAYGSVVEVTGAFIIGFILAVILQKSKSITPCLIIHITYNLLAIIVMRLLI